MTTIRATCPQCGEVDLTPADIELVVVRGGDEPVGPRSHYSFTCPECDERVVKPADERVARLLSTGGVSVTHVDELAAAPGHPEHPPAGPPLTYDDLLDLHFLLDGDVWFDHILTPTA